MRTAITIVFWCCVAANASALSTLRGSAVRIAGGDHLIINAKEDTHSVRLAEIDAPEEGQPYADQARKVLSELVLGKAVEIVVIGEDGNGRLVGRVFAGMVDVNAELVRRGLAWVNPETVRDPVLVELEKIARTEKRGLWIDPHAIPPWDWRAGDRQVQRDAFFHPRA